MEPESELENEQELESKKWTRKVNQKANLRIWTCTTHPGRFQIPYYSRLIACAKMI